jgi:hypothetical protein
MAQLNFSPSWGKRLAPGESGCKPNMDALMYVYKIIQVGHLILNNNFVFACYLYCLQYIYIYIVLDGGDEIAGV